MTTALKILSTNVGGKTVSSHTTQQTLYELLQRNTPLAHVLVACETRHKSNSEEEDRQNALLERHRETLELHGYQPFHHGPTVDQVKAQAARTLSVAAAANVSDSDNELDPTEAQRAAFAENEAHRSVQRNRHSHGGISVFVHGTLVGEVLWKDDDGYEMTVRVSVRNKPAARSCTIHAVYGKPPTERLEQMQALRARINAAERVIDTPDVIIGDINCVLDATLDRRTSKHQRVQNIPRTLSVAERAFSAIVNEDGTYLDAWRLIHKSNQEFSWRRGPVGDDGTVNESRIDHALVRTDLVAHVENCWYSSDEADRVTDHVPICVELNHITIEHESGAAGARQRAPPKPDRKVYNTAALRHDREKRDSYVAGVDTAICDKDDNNDIFQKDVDTLLSSLNDAIEVSSEKNELIELRRGGVADNSEEAVAHRRLRQRNAHYDSDKQLQDYVKWSRRYTKAYNAYLGWKPLDGQNTPEHMRKLYSHLPVEWRPSVPIIGATASERQRTDWVVAMRYQRGRLIHKIANRRALLNKQSWHKYVEQVMSLDEGPMVRQWWRIANQEKNAAAINKKELSRVVDNTTGAESSDPATVMHTIHQHFTRMMSAQPCDANNFPFDGELPPYLQRYAARPVFYSQEYHADAQRILLRPIDDDELTAHLRNVKTAKAGGPDAMLGEMYRYFDERKYAFMLLRTLFNRILATKQTPNAWRLANVWLIHKAGDWRNVTNYRPITLSNVTYKLFMSIITSRYNCLLEKHNIISNIQGGFRARRGCQQKLQLAVALHRHAQQHDEPLSCLYVDIEKAYDSVSHVAMWNTFRAMGLPTAFIELMQDIYRDNKVQILTPYGPTDTIAQQRGLRQGCPASCPFFNTFVDPVLHELDDDDTLEGYTYLDTDNRPQQVKGLAYADDLKMATKHMPALVAMMTRYAQFCVFNGVRIALEPPDAKAKRKTVFCTSDPAWNTDQTRNDTFDVPVFDPTAPHGYVMRPVPRIEHHETYKYLGVHLNHACTWERQRSEMIRKANTACAYASQSLFTVAQTVRSLNAILVPRLTYAMGVMEHSDENVRLAAALDARIKATIKRKMRLIHGVHSLHSTQKQLGVQLSHIPSLMAAIQIDEMAKALNSIDPQTRSLTRALYTPNTPPHSVAVTYLPPLVVRKHQYHIQSAQTMRHNTGFTHGINVSALVPKDQHHQLTWLAAKSPQRTITVADLFSERSSRPRRELCSAGDAEARLQVRANEYELIKRYICEHGTLHIHPHITAEMLGNRHFSPVLSVRPPPMHDAPPSGGTIEVFTDASTSGSAPNVTMAYALVSDHPAFNYSRAIRVVDHTNNTGELLAIVETAERLAETCRANNNADALPRVALYTDSKSMMAIASAAIAEVWNANNYPLLPVRAERREPNDTLRARRQLRNALVDLRQHWYRTTVPIQIHHVYAHSVDWEQKPDGVPSDDDNRRMAAMQKQFGDRWRAIVDGNARADRAANDARRHVAPIHVVISQLDDDYPVVQDNKRTLGDPRREIHRVLRDEHVAKYHKDVRKRDDAKPFGTARQFLTLRPEWTGDDPNVPQSIDKAAMVFSLDQLLKQWQKDKLLTFVLKVWHDCLPAERAYATAALQHEATVPGASHYARVLGAKNALGAECPFDECNARETKWHSFASPTCKHPHLCLAQRMEKVRSIIVDAFPAARQPAMKRLVRELPAWWHEQHGVVTRPHTTNQHLRRLAEFNKTLGSIGAIPRALGQWLRHLQLPPSKTTKTLHAVMVVIVEGAHRMWTDRCAQFERLYTAHKKNEKQREQEREARERLEQDQRIARERAAQAAQWQREVDNDSDDDPVLIPRYDGQGNRLPRPTSRILRPITDDMFVGDDGGEGGGWYTDDENNNDDDGGEFDLVTPLSAQSGAAHAAPLHQHDVDHAMEDDALSPHHSDGDDEHTPPPSPPRGRAPVRVGEPGPSAAPTRSRKAQRTKRPISSNKLVEAIRRNQQERHSAPLVLRSRDDSVDTASSSDEDRKRKTTTTTARSPPLVGGAPHPPPHTFTFTDVSPRSTQSQPTDGETPPAAEAAATPSWARSPPFPASRATASSSSSSAAAAPPSTLASPAPSHHQMRSSAQQPVENISQPTAATMRRYTRAHSSTTTTPRPPMSAAPPRKRTPAPSSQHVDYDDEVLLQQLLEESSDDEEKRNDSPPRKQRTPPPTAPTVPPPRPPLTPSLRNLPPPSRAASAAAPPTQLRPTTAPRAKNPTRQPGRLATGPTGPLPPVQQPLRPSMRSRLATASTLERPKKPPDKHINEPQ